MAFGAVKAAGKFFLKKIKAPGQYADNGIEREHYGCLGLARP